MFPFAASAKSHTFAETGAADSVLLACAPKLKEAAERISASLVKGLQKMASKPGVIDGKVRELALREMREVVGAHSPSGIACLINCPTVPCTLLATIDAMMVHGLVDLLCGGSGTELPPTSLRDVTPIDQQFAQIVFTLLAGTIEVDWSDAGFGAAGATKIERIAVDVLGLGVREIGCIDLAIGIAGVEGLLRLVLPLTALDRFAGGGEAPLGTDAADSDGVWSSLLHQKLGQAPVQLDAYLDAMGIELGALAALRVGQILALPAAASTRASLVAQGQLLFKGEIGQADDRYTLRIDDVISDVWAPTPVTPPSSRFHATEPPRV